MEKRREKVPCLGLEKMKTHSSPRFLIAPIVNPLLRRIEEAEAAGDVWRADYLRYLISDQWQERRRRALERDGYRCQSCGYRAYDVHHLTYARFGEEADEDLISLCRSCHDGEDNWIAYHTTPAKLGL